MSQMTNDATDWGCSGGGDSSGGGGWGSSPSRGRGASHGRGRGASSGRGRGASSGGGWGASSGGDWGTSSNGSRDKSTGGGWGESSGGDWGTSSDGSRDKSSGGDWGASSGGSRDISSGEGRNASSGGDWGNDKPSGGGWGNDKPSGGGWGNDKPSGGGWGNDKPSGGGWGNDKPSGGSWNNDKPSGGGWGNDKPSDQDDQPRKRFKNEDGLEEERPAPYKPEEINLDEEAELQGEGAGINFKKYDEQKVICLPPGAVTPIEKFEDVIESELLLKNIQAQKYTGMTPIQKWSMPAILAKKDLIGCAQTGSGKTAAFLLPVIQDLLRSELEPSDPNSDCQNPYCVIISPTRELARQIQVHAGMLCRDSIIKCCVIYGQISTAHLKAQLSRGCHILVATPGRLKDFVERNWIGFSNVRYIILDEGDRLVDDGFGGETKNFFEHPTMPPKDQRQTLFFSATFKDDIQMSAKEYLKDDFIFLTVGRIGAANEDIKQEFLRVSRQEKKRELKKILNEVPETEKTIVFTQTKMAADMLAGFFTALNLSSTSIHGDRHQSQREQAIRAFKKGEKRFLISSPVGNRGLDLPKVALVINYDLPNNIDEYVHRIGRTGRAGHTGRAISFYDEERDREILPSLIEILKEVKQEIPDWMQGGGLDSGTGGGTDSWDTAQNASAANDDWSSVPSANKTGPAASDDWGAQASSDNKSAQASSDNWGTPTKETPEETAPSTNSSADLW